jgi:hypothetical protein
MKALVPLLLIVLCVAMYFMYITPVTLEVKTLLAEKARYDDLLEKTQEIVEIRNSVLNDYNSISEDQKARLSKIVPETFTPVLFMNDLTSLAGKYNLGIADFKTAEPDDTTAGQIAIVDPTAQQKYKANKVSFKVSGQYTQFVKFLTDLETSLELVDVTGLSITSGTTNGAIKDGVLDYTVELNTYSLN